MKNKAAIHQNLFDRILDTRNIYSAIFCMESYIFDKGLLDTEKKVDLFNEAGEIIETIANDLELYSALADKHNVKLIEMVISVCQQRLKGILSNKDELFCARIYFKLKKYDTNSGELKFRPLHTARLIDLICMVSILNCLMYEDDYSSWQRNLSDLSKLVPHNFFGNIPSTNVQYLFHKWQTKYKEYTENVIEHCRRYQKDHTFQTEVCLDIKNFFPSISPKLLYDYIIDKLSSTYKSDLEQLKMAVAKLLYFKLEEKNIKPWKNYYYPTGFESTEEGLYMNYGIPQGLPQSYFFGNLCMIEVKTLLLKDDIFKGDAYFYVDDSVIYVQSKLDKQAFQERIRTLNSRLKKWCHKVNQTDTDLADYVCNLYLNFHEKLCYEINFHEDDKSVFTPIDEIDNQFELIFNMSRRASQVAKFSWNMDEVDDYVTLGKLNALDTVIAQEIEKLKKQENSNDEKKQDIAKSRLKLLRRFKKFFLYRKRKLMIRETGGPDDKVIQEFKERFLNNIDDIERWFEHNDEDIFQAEYQLLIQNLSKSEAKKLSEDIKCWEISILKSQNILENELYESLFYAKDAECAFQIKSLSQDICFTHVLGKRKFQWNEKFKF